MKAYLTNYEVTINKNDNIEQKRKNIKKKLNIELTVGVLMIGGSLLSKFDDCRSTRTGGAIVVGGAGVAIGTSVPS